MINRFHTGSLHGLQAALAAILISATAPVMPAAGTIQVAYQNPEKFTDVGDNSYITTDTRRDELLAQLARHIERHAVKRIPVDSSLVINIADIDMAGGFERWRRGGLDRVRIMKDVYPPRIKLEFRLINLAGKTIAEGRRELTDSAFMTSLDYRDDLLRYEKKLLDDWLVREFPDAFQRRTMQ